MNIESSSSSLAPSAPARSSIFKQLAQRLEVRMLALALLIGLCLSLLSPYFLTQTNIFNMLDQSVVIGIV
jgi:ribose transport system permease protein